MTNDRMRQLETQQGKVMNLESAKTWLNELKAGRAELTITENRRSFI